MMIRVNLKTIGQLQVGDKLYIHDGLAKLDIRSHWQPMQRAARNVCYNGSNRLNLVTFLCKLYKDVWYSTKVHINTLDNTPYKLIQPSTHLACKDSLAYLRSLDRLIPVSIVGLDHLCTTYKNDFIICHELKLYSSKFKELAERIHSYVLGYNPRVVQDYLFMKNRGIINLYGLTSIPE